MAEPRWISGPQQFITVKDAAIFLGCSIDLIYDYIKEKPPEGIPVKIIKRQKRIVYRIPKNKFLKWADFSKDN